MGLKNPYFTGTFPDEQNSSQAQKDFIGPGSEGFLLDCVVAFGRGNWSHLGLLVGLLGLDPH